MMSPAAAAHPYRTAMTPANVEDDRRGASFVDASGRPLVLAGATLSVTAAGGVARSVLEQRFENPYPETLRVTYKLPLPADGAVSGFDFQIGARHVTGEVDTKGQARERFERAISEGRTAALLDEERSSVFTETIGNVPPGATIVVRITVDQRLAWLDEGAWEYRFPTVIGPRYRSASTTPEEHARVAVPTVTTDTGHRMALSVDVRDRLPSGARVESPSHRLGANGDGTHGLASAKGEKLDRDVVVRWGAAEPAVGVRVAVARPERGRPHAADAYALLTVVPPAPRKDLRAVPRDLVILLDTSGSMAGLPLSAAKRIVGLAIDSLGADDSLELIEFSDAPRRFRPGAMPATPALKREAAAWLAGLEASGCTDMRTAVLDALRSLRHGAQRQVVLVTDGYIDGERELVELMAERMPAGCRFHVVGVGAAVNRTLSSSLARAGRGAEVLADSMEDAERGAARLLARTAQPVLTDVVVSGDALIDHAPELVPDVFMKSPLLCAARVKPEGGTLIVRGQGPDGPWQDTIVVPPCQPGEGAAGVVALWAREHVEDLETRWTIGRDQSRIDREIERTGLVYQIATRLTSWVAIDHERSVDPTKGSREETLAQELPLGTLAESFGLRPAPMFALAAPAIVAAAPAMPMGMAPPPPMAKTLAGGYGGPFDDSDDEEVAALRSSHRVPAFSPPMQKAKKESASEWDDVTADMPAMPEADEGGPVTARPAPPPPAAMAPLPRTEFTMPAYEPPALREEEKTAAKPTASPPPGISQGMVQPLAGPEPPKAPEPAKELDRAPAPAPATFRALVYVLAAFGALALLALLLALVVYLLSLR